MWWLAVVVDFPGTGEAAWRGLARVTAKGRVRVRWGPHWAEHWCGVERRRCLLSIVWVPWRALDKVHRTPWRSCGRWGIKARYLWVCLRMHIVFLSFELDLMMFLMLCLKSIRSASLVLLWCPNKENWCLYKVEKAIAFVVGGENKNHLFGLVVLKITFMLWLRLRLRKRKGIL